MKILEKKNPQALKAINKNFNVLLKSEI